MPSLRQLLAAHPALLLIDSASTRVQVGLWSRGDAETPRWRTSDQEAGTAIFACAETLLEEARLRVADLKAVVFCEGPGSVLGVRLAAAALRTWRVVAPGLALYGYQSLPLVAHALGRTDVTVISDARREAWHAFRLGDTLRRVTTGELSGELAMPEHFRSWTALPGGVQTVGYDVAALLQQLPDADLFHSAAEPDAFLHEDPSYLTWTPQVHQAPSPSVAGGARAPRA